MGRRATKLTVLALALCLLAGCGRARTAENEGLFYEATDVPPDTVLLTVDGREVTGRQYFYALATTCDAIRDACQAAHTAVEETLSGQSDYAASQALASVALYATVENWAERYGCELTDASRQHMDEAWAARTAEYGGEAHYLDALHAMGLDKASARRLAEDREAYLLLYDLYCTQGSPLHPTAAAVAAFAEQQPQPTADAHFDSLLQAAADEAEIVYTKAWKPLAADAFYARLTAARETLTAKNR